ncbi:hypothetical protein J2Z69_000757 [Paenibacillus shirakamiensis]|uniref:Phage ABA sandwich domain-containing protein n=1 Tax=Paenibacillus shirakamiensis TaxID=1265935 RepID=A0ABS4JDG7_9BACL|nr:hypothetical protein [Paenibacillus shirakamiensis]MBP1999738.1 hypothetical protein [Paenibacillus shirakamiensis]
MTPEQLLALEPGRELNRLVALKVMGYEQSRFQVGYVRKGAYATYPKHYSSDISAAWEVVERFPIVNLSRIEIFEGNYHHAVEIYADSETNEPSMVEAHTAPEAICKAALLAVMDKEE